jgi:hypothetical protein
LIGFLEEFLKMRGFCCFQVNKSEYHEITNEREKLVDKSKIQNSLQIELKKAEKESKELVKKTFLYINK